MFMQKNKIIRSTLAFIMSVIMVTSILPSVAVNAATAFYWPVDVKYDITTDFYDYDDHNGVDMAAPTGTPVYANFSGTAVYYQVYTEIKGVKTLTSFGNCVYITSDDGTYFAQYAHLNAFEGYELQIPSTQTLKQSGSDGKLEIGRKSVNTGDLLGYVGSTGNSSGPHLHYGLKVNSVYVDPEKYLDQSNCANSSNAETPDTPVVSDTWYQDYNPNYNPAITPELIQAFLESKSGGLASASLVNGKTVLDINGTYYDLGFDSYYAHTNTIASSNPLKQSSTGKVLTPAQIIYYACVENNMNVVWILANLQKEQSLIGSIENNYQTRLNRAVGYMKFENDERSHYEAGEKYYGFIGQVIGATYQFSQYIKNGTTTMAGGYEKYTPSSESGNMAFSNFKTNIYDKYAEWFDANMDGGSSGTEYLDYPVITSPSASKTYTAGNDITFAWDNVDGADYYLIGIKDETSGETLTGEVLGRTSDDDNIIEGTSCTLDGEYVVAGHKYKFAVGANSDDGNTSGGWSSVTITVSENSEVTPDEPDTDYGTAIGSGSCGENLTWKMYDSGVLVISGNGAMTSLSANAYPWYSYIGKIVKIVIENEVTSIGRNAFEYCKALASVEMGKSVTTLGEYAFSGCTALTTITVPDALTSIGYRALNNTTIRKVLVPESVVSIHLDILNYWTITSFVADNEDTVGYYTIDGILYHYNEYTDETTLVRCPTSKTVRSFTVPEDVDVIGRSAFQYNDSLASITFHDNITSIGAYAFTDCDALTNIVIPEWVKSIGKNAFEDCKALASVEMGKSVTTLGDYAFNGCTALTTMYFYGNAPTSVGYRALNNVPSDCIIYYIEGTTGWTNPWNGFTTETFTLEDATVSVTGVKLNKSTATLTVGSTTTLTATITPSNATDLSVTWTSSNASVAKVSGGKVTAVSAGTAVITVMTTDGGYTASCIVTVEDVEVEVPEEAPVIKVVSVTGRAGKTVDVKINITNNTGITGAIFRVNYDSALTLTNVVPGDAFNTLTMADLVVPYLNPVVLSWDGDGDDISNGTLVTLTFAIPEGMAAGDYPIVIAYDADDIYDSNLNDVTIAVENGQITVTDIVYGDYNNDGKINGKDLTLIRRYISGGFDLSGYDAAAADVNLDGKLNGKDLTLIRRFISGGFNITLGQ